MGFEGSVMAMITTLKNNANLLKRKSGFDKWYGKYNKSDGRKLNFKTLTENELSQIKSKIYAEGQKERKKMMLLSMLIILPLLAVGIFLTRNIIDTYKKDQKRENRIIMELSQQKEDEVLSYLNEGYELMIEGKYLDAKNVIYEAFKIEQDDYRIMVAYTKAFIYDCIYNNNQCKSAENLLKKAIDDAGEIDELKELQEMLVHKRK